MNAETSPLANLRVVEMTEALAGPYCAMLLGDLGADVIKVESPRGDMVRIWGGTREQVLAEVVNFADLATVDQFQVRKVCLHDYLCHFFIHLPGAV